MHCSLREDSPIPGVWKVIVSYAREEDDTVKPELTRGGTRQTSGAR